MSAATILSFVVHWIAIPSVFLLTSKYSIDIVRNSQPRELNVSATAGFFAGLLLLVMFVAFDLVSKPQIAWNVEAPARPRLLFIVMSAAAGFGLLWLIRKLTPTRLVGLITLILTAGSTIGLYGYVFITALRAVILSIALGFAFGGFVHIIFFPRTLDWRRRKAEGAG